MKQPACIPRKVRDGSKVTDDPGRYAGAILMANESKCDLGRRLRRWAIQGVSLGILAAGVWGEEAEPGVAAVKSNQTPARELPAPLPRTMVPAVLDEKALPIDLPGVLDLAKASSIEIQKATEKVNEAQIGLQLARTQWLPSLNLGASWLKHEGRTQDIPGQIINTSKASLFGGGIANATIDPQKAVVECLKAKQNIYAQSGELDRATRKSLQDAALAYVDLVAAQAGVAMSHEVEALIAELVRRSELLLENKLGAEVEVLSNQARLESQRQQLIKSRGNQLAASAQLVQILHLPSSTRLYANEEHLGPIQFVDEERSEEELVALAQDHGPGLQEIVALLAALEDQKKQIRRILFVPTVTASLGQGTFGGGFGGTLNNFGNTTDIGVGAYWDVMRIVGTSQTRNLFESKRRQASLQYEEIMSKLASGVVVSRHMSRQAKERIQLAESEIQTAIRSYQLSQKRLMAAETTSFEVMQAIGILAQARGNYLQAVIDYNRAQIQLQYLLGINGTGAPLDCPTGTPGEVHLESQTSPLNPAGATEVSAEIPKASKKKTHQGPDREPALRRGIFQSGRKSKSSN